MIYFNQFFNVFGKIDIINPQHTCPICYEPKLAFKKQHKNLPNHPPHLVYTDCDELMKDTLAQNGQIFLSRLSYTSLHVVLLLLPLVRYLRRNDKK